VPGTERRSAARMALPRRLLQVPAGFNFAPGPDGQPGRQPWAARPPPDVRGAGVVPAAPPPVPQFAQSLNGVAMAGVVASEPPALTARNSLVLQASCASSRKACAVLDVLTPQHGRVFGCCC